MTELLGFWKNVVGVDEPKLVNRDGVPKGVVPAPTPVNSDLVAEAKSTPDGASRARSLAGAAAAAVAPAALGQAAGAARSAATSPQGSSSQRTLPQGPLFLGPPGQGPGQPQDPAPRDFDLEVQQYARDAEEHDAQGINLEQRIRQQQADWERAEQHMLDTYGTISEAVKAAHDKRRADLEAEQRRHLEAAQRLAERGDSLIRDLDAANPPDGGPYRSPGNARAVVQGIRARFPRRPATGGTTGPQERPPQRTTTSSRTKGNGDPKAPARRPTRKRSDDP
jgi:hypothetical protein